MNLFFILVILLAGLALGVFFYGGLWLTIRVLPHARHPVGLMVCSFWTRMLIALAGFLLLTGTSWQYALIALAGFIFGRFAVSRSMPVTETRAKCP